MKLDIETEQVDALAAQLTAILDHIDQISAWEGSGRSTAREDAPVTPRRADTPGADCDPTLIDCAADHEGGEVRVPQVVGAP